MSSDTRTYDDLAQDILRDYLRSAVIIDDQWPKIAATEIGPGDPDESNLIDEGILGDIETESSGRAEDVIPERPVENALDARLLIELQQSLLREGLLACGFRYTHRTRSTAVNLARRADIVILDWHLVADEGAEAMVILSELQGDDLRFVCIFTGHGRVAEVYQALENYFGKENSVPGVDKASLRIGNLVIAIRNKKGMSAETRGFTVRPGELFGAALRGLAGSYDGLVQLAMLELTQEHRRQLPAILKRLDKSIDMAVLLEAGDKFSPVGQGGAFLAVLIDEWRAHLQQEQMKLRALGPEGIRLFGSRLAERLPRVSRERIEEALKEAGVGKAIASKYATEAVGDRGRVLLQEWLTQGCRGEVPSIPDAPLKRERHQAGWGLLRAIAGEREDDRVSALLRLDALFHQQFEKAEKLTQGTLVAVVREEILADYYLCITPLCDAERPDRVANLFSFLRTKIIDQKCFSEKERRRRAAYCVVEDRGQLICLEILLKQRIILEVPDRSFDRESCVLGLSVLGHGDTATSVSLLRVAQLRSEHALSITAAAAADSARVGVSRVEFVRARLS